MSKAISNIEVLYILSRAIVEGVSIDNYDGINISDEAIAKINFLVCKFFDLFDEHLNARDKGDIERSTEILAEILSHPSLRLIATYFMDEV